MTLMIDLSPDEESRLRQEASARGLELDQFVRIALLDELSLHGADDLTSDEVAEIRAGIRRGLAAAERGSEQPYEQWVQTKRGKYGIDRPDPAA